MAKQPEGRCIRKPVL